VQVEHSFMARYVESLPLGHRSKTVLMLHDVTYLKYERMSRLEGRLARKLRLWVYSRMMRGWEPRYAQRFDRCITVSESDRDILRKSSPLLVVDVIPNGIDIHEYRQLPMTDKSPSLIFVGNMDYLPNVDAVTAFCHRSLPIIREQFSNVELWIVGVNPAKEVLDLRSRSIHVTGQVSDVRPFYCRATASVVPLRAGGGTRLKILESMALGRPVVSTSIGCEGLDVTDGVHLLIGDDMKEIALKTIKVLADRSLQKRLADKARELAVARYGWDSIAQRLCDTYEQLLDGNNRNPCMSAE
jgi:glycosyltransferase involved in cell wall biosynthesis